MEEKNNIILFISIAGLVLMSGLVWSYMKYQPRIVDNRLVMRTSKYGEVMTDFGRGPSFYGVEDRPEVGDRIWGISIRRTQHSESFIEPSYYRDLIFYRVVEHKSKSEMKNIHRTIKGRVVCDKFENGKTKMVFENGETVFLKYDWTGFEDKIIKLGYYVAGGWYEENEVDCIKW